jgi:hypothetical protein
MAHVISSLTPDNSTDAAFRAWGLGISTALKSLFTFVTQTGEINWSTVVKPTAANQKSGFEVYRFNDTAQSTAPIFFKVEYGSGAGGATCPAVYITVGKSTNGSGTLSNILLPLSTVIECSTIPTVASSNCYFGNGDGSCLVISLWPNNVGFQNYGSYVAIERSRDITGNPTDLAIWWQYSGSTNTAGDMNQCTDYIAETRNSLAFGAVPILYPLTTPTPLSNGTTTPVFTGSVITPQRVSWVPTSILGCSVNDLGTGVIASALIGGIDYLSVGNAGSYSDTGKQQYATVLLRWD